MKVNKLTALSAGAFVYTYYEGEKGQGYSIDTPVENRKNSNELVDAFFDSMSGVELKAAPFKRLDFDLSTGLIHVDGREISPDSDLDSESDQVKTFAAVLFTVENVKTYNDKKPTEYETEEEDFEQIQLIDNKYTLVKGTRQNIKLGKEPVFNTDGSRTIKDGKPLFVEVPKVKSK